MSDTRQFIQPIQTQTSIHRHTTSVGYLHWTKLCDVTQPRPIRISFKLHKVWDLITSHPEDMIGRSMAAPTPVFFAQQYSSETFVSMRFQSHKKKFDAQFKKKILFLPYNCWSRGVPVDDCTGFINPQITIPILTAVNILSHIKQYLLTSNQSININKTGRVPIT